MHEPLGDGWLAGPAVRQECACPSSGKTRRGQLRRISPGARPTWPSALHSRLRIRFGDRVETFGLSICIEHPRCARRRLVCRPAVVPINFKLHAKEAAWIIENAEAKTFSFPNRCGRVNSLYREIAGTCCHSRRWREIRLIPFFDASGRRRSHAEVMIWLGSSIPRAPPASRKAS